jgi:hypothetical protein
VTAGDYLEASTHYPHTCYTRCIESVGSRDKSRGLECRHGSQSTLWTQSLIHAAAVYMLTSCVRAQVRTWTRDERGLCMHEGGHRPCCVTRGPSRLAGMRSSSKVPGGVAHVRVMWGGSGGRGAGMLWCHVRVMPAERPACSRGPPGRQCTTPPAAAGLACRRATLAGSCTRVAPAAPEGRRTPAAPPPTAAPRRQRPPAASHRPLCQRCTTCAASGRVRRHHMMTFLAATTLNAVMVVMELQTLPFHYRDACEQPCRTNDKT